MHGDVHRLPKKWPPAVWLGLALACVCGKLKNKAGGETQSRIGERIATHTHGNTANMHERKLAPHAGVSVAGPKRKPFFFLALPRVWARCAYLSPHPPVCVKPNKIGVSEMCPVTVFFVHAFQKRPHGRPDGGGGKSQKKKAVFSRSARRGCYRGVWRMVGRGATLKRVSVTV